MDFRQGGLALLALAAGAVHAGDTPTVVRHYTVADGLPVSSTSVATIDGDGFLWIATHDGLARFDGRQFVVHDAERDRTIASNRFIGLYRDRLRRIFALNDGGALFRAGRGSMRNALTGPDATMPVSFVQDDPLCATQASGLSCVDADGRFVRRLAFPADSGITAALPVSADHAWLIAPGRGLWLGSARSPWKRLLGDEVRLAPAQPVIALVDREGALWAVFGKRLLHARLDAEPQWLRLGEHEPPGIVQLRLDPDGSVWIGTSQGVFRHAAGRVQRAFPGSDDDAIRYTSFSWRAPDGQLWHSRDGALYRGADKMLDISGTIESVFFDDFGTAWVMTKREGFYALLQPRVDVLDTTDGLGTDNLYGVDSAADGTLWLGSLGGGLQALHAEGRIDRYGHADGLSGDNPWAVAVAPNGDVYTATYAPGLFRKRPHDTRFARIPLPDAAAQAQVRSISFDAQEGLWIGTTAGVWRQVAGDWRSVDTGAPGDNGVTALLHARDGSTWFGLARGLRRRWHDHTHVVAPELLYDAHVRGLYQDSDGAVWASTEGHGLVRIAEDDPRGERALRLGRAQGLPSSSPHAVLQDATGNFWVNSNQGIFRISRRGLNDVLAGRHSVIAPMVLGASDGVAELEGNGGVQPISAIDPQGRLWFPTQRGLVRIDPRKLPERSVEPRPVIDSLVVGNATLATDVGAEIVLPDHARALDIRYGAADLQATGEIRFRYRLLPAQPQWTEAGSRRTMSFAALAPGPYRFELIAGNGDDVWSATPASVAFSIAPYWHETRLFRVGLVCGVVLLLAVFARRRTRLLRAQATALKRTVRLRTSELRREKANLQTALHERERAHEELAGTHVEVERSHSLLAEQAVRLQAQSESRTRLLADISHELRTPLMLVRLPLKHLSEKGDGLRAADRQRLTQTLRQTDRLNALVEQLIDLARAEGGQLKLRVARLDLGRFVRAVATSYEPIAEQADVRIDVNGPPEFTSVFADPGHLTTVLGNLIDNACGHAPGGSRVRIEIRTDPAGDYVRVAISDSGQGFPPEVAERLFERFFRSRGPDGERRQGLGIGLALARELVDLHGGRIGAGRAPAGGAEFWFELPLGSAHVQLGDLALEADASATSSLSAIETRPPSARGTAVRDDGIGLLLVEDHPDLAAYLGERLAEYVPVVSVDSAELALDHLAAYSAAVLVTDVVLPGLSGIELCRRVRASARDHAMPVLLFSARTTEADRAAALQAGAAEFLCKPFEFETLLDAIARVWPAMRARIDARAGVRDNATLDPLLRVANASFVDAEFGILQWSARVHLSERQLRRRIGELTGMTPQAWLREQRLLNVRSLVRLGKARTLAEAGALSGIDNPNYLYRLYRARFGSTPP